MQNRNFIKVVAIVFAIICVYQLSFTFVADKVENDAIKYSENFPEEERLIKEKQYLDSINSEEVYDILLAQYTYADCKQRELNLGLDLKGGMNVTLEVMVVDVLKALANNTKDEVFNNAISNAKLAQEDSQKDFVTLFGEEFEKLSPSNGMAVLFTSQLKEKVKINSTNSEVIEVLSLEVEDAINRSFNILRSRIDRFGVTQPNIQRLETAGRILVELPGIKDPERARKLLQSTAQLEFWETYEYRELFQSLEQVNAYLKETNELNDTLSIEELIDSPPVADKKKELLLDDINSEELISETDDLLSDLESDSSVSDTSESLSFEEFAIDNPLYSVLYPNVDQQNQIQEGPVVGFCATKDTSQLNKYLKDPAVLKFLPVDVRFSYTVKPYDSEGKFVQLVALKVTNRDGLAAMEGNVVTDATQSFGQYNSSAEVSMSMNQEGAKQWKRLTGENIGRSVAIVLDGYVYSYPTVQSEIAGGRSSITGNFSVNEAKDLANILKSGKLPAPARIIEEAIVGPSLGEEAISSGLQSFIFALILVLFYMIFYYSGAGLVSNVALLANIFFIFGVLSSIGAVLTLPGIAGIILTIGMSVDANVLIYERIREELTNGKGLRLAITDGYNSAYSSIIDANVTTLLTGIVLYTFGTGPIKGFALTLMIGIATSLFTAVFISRLLIDSAVNKNSKLTFNTSFSKGWFQNINVEFLKKRKIAYAISGAIIIAGIISIFSIGLKQGVDFKGGRSFVVRFDQDMNATKVAESLKDAFVTAPEVKTYGTPNQLKITTVYRIDDEGQQVDEQVQSALFTGLKPYLGNTTYQDFKPGFEKEGAGVMSYIKVEPTIADDIKTSALYAVFGSLLVVFLYILLRFRKISFSIGAVIAVFHDVLIVLSVFSICYSFMPFDMEIGQSFIAAILTVVGYSLNDTVVIFDRIREFAGIHKTWKYNEVVDKALSSTLGLSLIHI